MNKEIEGSSWERIGIKTLHDGLYAAAFSSLPFTFGLFSEIICPNLIQGTLDEAVQIVPKIMAGGFSVGFVLGVTEELTRIYGKRLVHETLKRTRRFEENNFISFPSISEINSHPIEPKDNLFWNMLLF